MKKALLSLLGFGIAISISIFIASCSKQRRLGDNLPEKIVAVNQLEAFKQVMEYANKSGGRIGYVVGTGSMVPYISKSAPSLDPYKTVVAYVVYSKDKKYEDMQFGDLVCYHPENAPKESWLHIAYEQDNYGWIMSGLNNKHSENWMRVTQKNFVGIVEKTFTWNQ